MSLGEFFNVNNPSVFSINLFILSLGLVSFLTFILAIKYKSYLENYFSILKFFGDASQFLGLIGTLVSLLSNTDKFVMAENIKDIMPMFLGAWSTTLLGMFVALISYLFITLLEGLYDEKSKGD